MTIFNFSLDAVNGSNINSKTESKCYPLTLDEIKLYTHIFGVIVDNNDNIPEKILNDMANILHQFVKTHTLSDAQEKYINDIYHKFC
jgi:hypothetical protein